MLLILSKKFLTVNLCLPDGISQAPQAWEHEEDNFVVWVRPPVDEGDNDSDIYYRSYDEDGNTTHHLYHRAKGDGAYGVTHPEADHHIANHVNAQPARHVRLQQQQQQ